MRKFLAALNNGIGACTGLGTYLMNMQRRCMGGKRPTDCDGVPSWTEARKDYHAAMKARSFSQ